MLNYKSNKQAFLIAALIIIVCLACLMGATLALFTSDPSDGTIGIITTSGDVEVGIVDTAGESLEGKYLAFSSSSGNADVVFEPGSVFFTQGFQISNEGDIPINFHLSVGKDNIVDIDGKKVDVEEFNEAFDVWIIDKKPSDRDALLNAQRLTDFKGSVAVDHVSDKTYYLVVAMKETAGNEFQGKAYMGIGVTVYAVQANAII